MDFTGASTAIMLALAAVLWFLYLMPTWFRRREYLATERNATRLQRTIRIMAETAEVPEEVRVEATARQVAERERLVRQEQRRVAAAERARLRAAAAAPTPAVVRETLARLRMRRTRRIASLLVVTAIAVGGLQLWMMVQTGAVLGSWLVLGASGAGLALGMRIQKRLDERVALLRTAAAPRRRTEWQEPVVESERSREWTPVPVPRPRYLENGDPVPVERTVDAAALMRAAAAEAERALRAAHAEPEVVPFRPSTGTEERSDGSRHEVRPASRYASMGIVDPTATAGLDVDAALLRRRTAG